MNGPEKSEPMTILLWAQFFHVRLQCCRAGWAVWCPNAWISVNSIGVFPPWEKPSSYWGTIDGNHHQWILMLYVYMYIYIYLLYMCVCKKMFEFVILCCKFFSTLRTLLWHAAQGVPMGICVLTPQVCPQWCDQWRRTRPVCGWFSSGGWSFYLCLSVKWISNCRR